MGMRGLLKKPARRPKKTGTERRRRDNAQRKRLVGLGVAEDAVRKMLPEQVKDTLRRPARIRKPAV